MPNDPTPLPAPIFFEDRYSFEEFVVGPHNRFSHAAALAVSENLGKAYNPLYFYGPVGIGKTHLMQAVGRRVLEKHPTAKTLYITAQHFMTEVIEFLQTGKLQTLHEKYQGLDLLLVDDIQSLASSESTQDEFFHIFNDLHAAGKQIVMTSDRPPQMLTTLEDRLRSRFEWGLIADIKPTNLETRIAILKKKETHWPDIHLTDDVRLYIAGRLKSNVREMEGFLKHLHASVQLNKEEITFSFVKETLQELLPPEEEHAEPPSGGGGVVPARPPSSLPREESASASPTKEPTIPAVETSPHSVTIEPDNTPPLITGNRAGPDQIPVVYFYPKGTEKELEKLKKKFNDVVVKHKLKFTLFSAEETAYEFQNKGLPELFVEQCRRTGSLVGIVLGPPPEESMNETLFFSQFHEAFEKDQRSLQTIPWDEINKDYRFLNIALDITLVRIRSQRGR